MQETNLWTLVGTCKREETNSNTPSWIRLTQPKSSNLKAGWMGFEQAGPAEGPAPLDTKALLTKLL